jgi:hypothetical protein
MRMMMVRILVDTSVDDRSVAELLVLEMVKGAMLPITERFWVAVDHPQSEHARALWSSIASNEDPNRPGHAAIYPTPTKPF